MPAAADPARRDALARLALCSDFAIDTLVRQPELLRSLEAEANASVEAPPVLADLPEADWPGHLRRWRAAASTRLVWRDVHGLDDVDATLAGASRIADDALQAGVAALSASLSAPSPVVRLRPAEPL